MGHDQFVEGPSIHRSKSHQRVIASRSAL
jgi:hypothetical protein